MGERRYWLVKSEPGAYSIDDLEADGRTSWDGVRNYQARNLMRDEMREGDGVLFYHSSANPPGVAGVAEVSKAGHPDLSAQDPGSPYHDPAATPDDPRWYMVEIRFVRKLPRLVPLDELKADPALEGMPVTTRSRLSVQPVAPEQFKRIHELAES